MHRLISRCLAKQVFVFAKLVMRRHALLRLVVLLPQDSATTVASEEFQNRPPGFSVFFLPFADEIRTIENKMAVQLRKVHYPLFSCNPYNIVISSERGYN
jgi:Ku70/Ku80 beta-barrel domain